MQTSIEAPTSHVLKSQRSEDLTGRRYLHNWAGRVATCRNSPARGKFWLLSSTIHAILPSGPDHSYPIERTRFICTPQPLPKRNLRIFIENEGSIPESVTHWESSPRRSGGPCPLGPPARYSPLDATHSGSHRQPDGSQGWLRGSGKRLPEEVCTGNPLRHGVLSERGRIPRMAWPAARANRGQGHDAGRTRQSDVL